MRCLECGSNNDENAAICIDCRASLRPARAMLYLERAEQELNEGKMSRARADIARFDIEMLTLSPELREHHQLPARSFWVQSLVYYNKGQMNEAKRELLQAQASLEQQPSTDPLLPRVLLKLGNINYYQGRIDEAIFNYLHSSELSAQLGDHATAAKVIANIGTTYLDQQRVDDAIASYEQSLREAELSGDASVIVQAHDMVATLYSQYGPFSSAIRHIGQALALLPQVQSLRIQAAALTEAGDVYIKIGDLDRAEQYLRQAERMIDAKDAKLTFELIALSLAELMRRRGEQQAWHGYIMAAEQAGSSNELMKSEVALHLAQYYSRRNDEVRARRHLQHLDAMLTADVQITAEDIIYVRRAQALLHAMLGEWDKADGCFREAVAQNSFSKYDLAITWRDYAAMLRRRGEVEQQPSWYTESEAAYEQAAMLLRELGLPYQR